MIRAWPTYLADSEHEWFSSFTITETDFESEIAWIIDCIDCTTRLQQEKWQESLYSNEDADQGVSM